MSTFICHFAGNRLIFFTGQAADECSSCCHWCIGGLCS